jgi:hypothetical protein
VERLLHEPVEGALLFDFLPVHPSTDAADEQHETGHGVHGE